MYMKKLLFSLAVFAMMMGWAGCEPFNNDNSPIIGKWAVEGLENRIIEFDDKKATVTSYESSGEVFAQTYFEYLIDRKRVYFAVYTADLELYVHECAYRFDGDNSVIITGLNPILYYGTVVDSSYNPTADVVLIKK